MSLVCQVYQVVTETLCVPPAASKCKDVGSAEMPQTLTLASCV
nr:MAG TPA: hypothetical protein [Caudoviricetes sp.]